MTENRAPYGEPAEIDHGLNDRALTTAANKLFADNKPWKDIKAAMSKAESELETPPAKIEKLWKHQDTAESVIQKHQDIMARGGIGTGYELLDNHFFFAPGDFNIVQSMSNHGKTWFMLNVACNMLRDHEKADIVFITYETSAWRVQERVLNLLARRENEDLIFKRTPGSKEYTYKHDGEIISAFNQYTASDRLKIWQGDGLGIEEIRGLIQYHKTYRKGRALVLFLDYFQIFPYDSAKGSDGWERIKELAYDLEKLTTQNEIITIAGSQVNEKGDPREGKDIYNAASNVIDLFNHSHDKLKARKDETRYIAPQYDKSVISLRLDKSKNFPSAYWQYAHLFDGYCYTENTQEGIDDAQKAKGQASKQGGSKKKSAGTTDYSGVYGGAV